MQPVLEEEGHNAEEYLFEVPESTPGTARKLPVRKPLKRGGEDEESDEHTVEEHDDSMDQHDISSTDLNGEVAANEMESDTGFEHSLDAPVSTDGTFGLNDDQEKIPSPGDVEPRYMFTPEDTILLHSAAHQHGSSTADDTSMIVNTGDAASADGDNSQESAADNFDIQFQDKDTNSIGMRFSHTTLAASTKDAALNATATATTTSSAINNSVGSASSDGDSGSVSADHKSTNLEATVPTKQPIEAKSDEEKLQPEKKTEAKANTAGKNLWITSLAPNTRATDLKALFSKCGRVITAKIVTSAKAPGSKCFGFVSMSSSDEATKCIQQLHRTELHGRMISVERAKEDNVLPFRNKSLTDKQQQQQATLRTKPVTTSNSASAVSASNAASDAVTNDKDSSAVKSDTLAKDYQQDEQKDKSKEEEDSKYKRKDDRRHERPSSRHREREHYREPVYRRLAPRRGTFVHRGTRRPFGARIYNNTGSSYGSSYRGGRGGYYSSGGNMRSGVSGNYYNRGSSFGGRIRRSFDHHDNVRQLAASRAATMVREDAIRRERERLSLIETIRRREMEQIQREEMMKIERERERLRLERERLEREKLELQQLQQLRQTSNPDVYSSRHSYGVSGIGSKRPYDSIGGGASSEAAVGYAVSKRTAYDVRGYDDQRRSSSGSQRHDSSGYSSSSQRGSSYSRPNVRGTFDDRMRGGVSSRSYDYVQRQDSRIRQANFSSDTRSSRQDRSAPTGRVMNIGRTPREDYWTAAGDDRHRMSGSSSRSIGGSGSFGAGGTNRNAASFTESRTTGYANALAAAPWLSGNQSSTSFARHDQSRSQQLPSSISYASNMLGSGVGGAHHGNTSGGGRYSGDYNRRY